MRGITANCNRLQRTTAYYFVLQGANTCCNKLQCMTTYHNILQHIDEYQRITMYYQVLKVSIARNTLQCSALQHITAYCIVLQRITMYHGVLIYRSRDPIIYANIAMNIKGPHLAGCAGPLWGARARRGVPEQGSHALYRELAH